jgi:hypothetical protein
MDQPVQPSGDVNLPPAPEVITPEVVQAPVQPKKKMSGWLIALIVLVVLCCCLVVVGLIAAGFYMQKNNWNLNQFQYLVPVVRYMV